MKTKIHRVRLPDPLSQKIESEAKQRGISVSQLLRERIILSSSNDVVSIQLLGSILKEAIMVRKYSAYFLATSVDDRGALRQIAARFNNEAEEAKNTIVNALIHEG